jgi:hypothetical protein
VATQTLGHNVQQFPSLLYPKRKYVGELYYVQNLGVFGNTKLSYRVETCYDSEDVVKRGKYIRGREREIERERERERR